MLQSKIIKRTILVLGGLTLWWGCQKRNVELTALLFAEALWEDRPAGVSCSPSPSPNTLQNGELTFDQDHMLCVDIQMAPNDFALLRNESRFGPSILDQNGATAVAVTLEYLDQCDVRFPSHYNWYTADIVIDGESASEVGIRKKGFLGSIFSVAPAMKINTNYHGSGSSIGSTEDITLNNNSEDPSRVMQCLNYEVFAMAGYPAPRANLANVSVNGEALGVYTHLEAINEDFLDRHFGNHSGDLYEGQLVDFISDWLPRWEPKTDATDPYAGPILEISDILAETSDADLYAALNAKVNIDQFVRFWALEVLLNHADGYVRNRNNFLVYFDPNDNGRAVFIPWGMNYMRLQQGDRLQDYVAAELPRRLSRIPAVREQFNQELQNLLDNVWDLPTLQNLVNNCSAHVETGQTDIGYQTHLGILNAWLANRSGEIQSFLDNGGLPIGPSTPASTCYQGT